MAHGYKATADGWPRAYLNGRRRKVGRSERSPTGKTAQAAVGANVQQGALWLISSVESVGLPPPVEWPLSPH